MARFGLSPRRYRPRWRLWLGALSVLLVGGYLILAILNEFSHAGPPLEDGLADTGAIYRGAVIASDPNVLKTGDGYRMFYSDLDVATSRTVIAQAFSDDGRNWQPGPPRESIPGLALNGRDGSWDENLESVAAVQTPQGIRLYYSAYRDEGYPTKGFPAALGLAVERSGSFERFTDDPILNPTPGWYDNDAIYSPTIEVDEAGVYHMIYVGHAYTDYSKIENGGVYLLYAWSPDGVTWTKAEEPIVRPGQFTDWKRDGIAEPWLMQAPDGQYLLFFTGLEGEGRAIGMAVGDSPKGPWTFRERPIVNQTTARSIRVDQTLAPSVIIEDGMMRMWYLAASGGTQLVIAEAEGVLDEFIE